jgi:hypothetical protein
MFENLFKRLLQFPTQFFLLVIGALLFLPGLGRVHLFDWDEINFAESAREMLLTGNWRMVQIDFQPFYEKPPLFIWLQALSMNYFGVNEYAARLPNAIVGMVTLLVVFNAGRSIFKSQLGVLWAILFACSVMPQVYFKSGIIDPLFNLLIFCGIYFLFKVTTDNEFEGYKEKRSNRRKYLILSALFIGLATLTKGPVAILLTILTATSYLIVNRGKLKIEFTDLLVWGAIIMLVLGSWLSFEVNANGIKFIDEFITYQIRLFSTEDAGHGGPWFYHFPVLLLGGFPASIFALAAFKPNEQDDNIQLGFKRWMIYLLAVVVIVFSIVKTKILHYSSLSYFPITFLGSYYLHYLFEQKATWTWKQTVPILVIVIAIVVSFTGVVFLIQRPDVFINYVKDDFAKTCLQATVYWSKNDLFWGVGYFVLVIIAISLITAKHTRWGVYTLLISTALFISILMNLIMPRIEKYSQAALIEFLAQRQGEDCTIRTAYFKSYAHLFYARKPIPAPGDEKKREYVITKVHKVDEVLGYEPYLTELYRKNGWVFLTRASKVQ